MCNDDSFVRCEILKFKKVKNKSPRLLNLKRCKERELVYTLNYNFICLQIILQPRLFNFLSTSRED